MNHFTLMRHVWTLAVCFVVNGCNGSDLPDPGENASSARQDAVRFLALGDSYTIGEGVKAPPPSCHDPTDAFTSDTDYVH